MPGLGLPNVQGVYDASNGVPHIVLAAGQPFTIRDNATPIGDLLVVEDNAGNDFLAVSATDMDLGLSTRRILRADYGASTGRGGFELWPDTFTMTTAPSPLAMFNWSGTMTSNIPGGGGLGNDGFGGFISITGEFIYADQGNLFNSGLLFNFGMTASLQANIGPLYTLIDQPTVRSISAGAKTMSQHNAVRAQPRVGPNTAGTMTATSMQLYFAMASVDGSGGAAAITTLEYFSALAPTLTGGGTIGTLNAISLANISGPTTIRGIHSLMNNGTFINHTGTAPSLFTSANVRFNDSVGVELGTGQDALLNWNGSAFEIDPAVGPDLRIAFAASPDRHTLTSSSAATDRQILFGMPKGAFGQTSTVGNQKYIFVANSETVTVAGEFSQFLLTQAGNDTLNAAMSLYAGWTINVPSPTLGTGSVTTVAGLNIGGNPSVGTNRVGLRILSNPSGGGGINAALWITAGRSRFDGRVDINNGVALGGGAPATLGTIGGSGPTAAAQAQWLEIDINGVAHWIPAWT